MDKLNQSGKDAARFGAGVSRWAEKCETLTDLAIQLADALESHAAGGAGYNLSEEEQTLITNAKNLRKATTIHKFYTWGELVDALKIRYNKKEYVNISVFLED